MTSIPRGLSKEDIKLLVTCIEYTIKGVREKNPSDKDLALVLPRLLKLKTFFENIQKLPFSLRLVRRKPTKKRS